MLMCRPVTLTAIRSFDHKAHLKCVQHFRRKNLLCSPRLPLAKPRLPAAGSRAVSADPQPKGAGRPEGCCVAANAGELFVLMLEVCANSGCNGRPACPAAQHPDS